MAEYVKTGCSCPLIAGLYGNSIDLTKLQGLDKVIGDVNGSYYQSEMLVPSPNQTYL